MSRRLIVLRHAQAGAGDGGDDRGRPLTGKGRDQATAVGAALAREGLLPDHVICSSALRTRETLDLVLAGLPASPTVDVSDALYSAGVDELFSLIGLVGPEVATLLVVGHNPTVAQAAAAFTDGRTLLAFPPATAAVVDLEVDWLHTAPGTGTGRLLD